MQHTRAMFHAWLPDLPAVLAIFFTAGVVKGMLGMGMPTVAMGLLGLLMPVASAAALLTVPSFATNVWQTVAGPCLAASVRRLWPMQLGIVVGVAGTALLLSAAPEALGRRLLGACLLAYGVVGLSGWRLPQVPARMEAVLGSVTGAATGIATGLTGVFVLPAVPYLQALGMGKEALTQALGLCFTTSTLALAAMLVLQGHLTAQASMGSLLMLLPAVAGMWAGQRIRLRMDERRFRLCFFVGLVLLGAWLMV